MLKFTNQLLSSQFQLLLVLFFRVGKDNNQYPTLQILTKKNSGIKLSLQHFNLLTKTLLNATLHISSVVYFTCNLKQPAQYYFISKSIKKG